MKKRTTGLSLALLALWLAGSIKAQPCEPGWHALGGVDKGVGAMALWDADGPGPEPTLLVAGGAFTMAGGTPASFIAAWNPETGEWRALGDAFAGIAGPLTTLPNGDLVAAGVLRDPGGAGVARWDGSGWHPLGSGMSGSIPPATGPVVTSLAVLPGGDLVAGGGFRHAGGVEVNGVAQWDGAAWRSLAGGTGTGGVGALAVAKDESLLAGVEPGIFRWDGASWAPFGDPMTRAFTDVISVVDVIAVMPEGDVIAGGSFSSAGGTPGTNRIARWDGSAWQALGSGMSGGPLGFTWVFDVAILRGGDIIAGGNFDAAGGVSASNIARWDGAEWSPLGTGLDGAVLAMQLLPNGDLVVGGGFKRAGGIASPHLAIWRDCATCYPDCDGSGSLDFFDFLCFQNLFAAMDPRADCDGDSAFTFFDFICFQNAFAAGCE